VIDGSKGGLPLRRVIDYRCFVNIGYCRHIFRARITRYKSPLSTSSRGTRNPASGPTSGCGSVPRFAYVVESPEHQSLPRKRQVPALDLSQGVDQDFVSSRSPKDIPVFNRKMIEELQPANMKAGPRRLMTRSIGKRMERKAGDKGLWSFAATTAHVLLTLFYIEC
jgi:hypothetical protein